jgi:hypothetical protein
LGEHFPVQGVVGCVEVETAQVVQEQQTGFGAAAEGLDRLVAQDGDNAR